MRKKDKEIIPSLGGFEHIVLLAIIRLRNNAYGMTIQHEIEERTGKSTTIGSIYTTLHRMEEKGFVKSFKGDPSPERGGRAKLFYQMEALGELALNKSWESIYKMRQGLRLKESEA